MKEKISGLLGDIRKYRNTPPPGRYMTFREILSLSGGGIGVRLVMWCVSQMIISTGNTLIGNTIGITPSALYGIYIISLVTAFPLTALRSFIIDNTRSMKGKYRPYIITMGIPSVILGSLFIWMPYERMSLFWKCFTVLAFNILFQFFYSFFTDAYDSLINVLSPNSIERSDVLSVRSVIENLSPSIVNILFPLLAKLITGENTLYDLKVFRFLFPPLLFVGFLISMIVYFNTEEKIVQAKSHFIGIRFSDALRAVAKNKYFWIISLAGWVGFLEGAFSNIMQWTYNYQNVCSASVYSVITAIAGNASFWPNLIAPFLIRKYGKKKILIYTNLLNVFFIALLLPVIRVQGTALIWLLLVFTFINQLITSLGHLLTPSVNADIRDYQQYVTGERIDGMFATVGLIGNIITAFTSFVVPMLYEKSGLNAETAIALGYDGSNVYDVLYNRKYFVSICSVLIIASVIGAAMNVIPYFFFDFTEAKQEAVVKVLKIRAYIEQALSEEASPEEKEEIRTIVQTAERYADRNEYDLKKEKKLCTKAELKEKAEHNRQVQSSRFLIKELERFDTDSGRLCFALYEKLVAAGADGFLSLSMPDRKTLLEKVGTDAQAKKDIQSLYSDIKLAKKTVRKYYPDGLTAFDETVFGKLFTARDKNEAKLTECAKALSKAKTEKDREAVAALREDFTSLKQIKREIKAELRKATAQNSVYHRAAKPYLEAIRFVGLQKGYAEIKKETAH